MADAKHAGWYTRMGKFVTAATVTKIDLTADEEVQYREIVERGEGFTLSDSDSTVITFGPGAVLQLEITDRGH